MNEIFGKTIKESLVRAKARYQPYVNLANNRTERITVFEGDSVDTLADEFIIKYNIFFLIWLIFFWIW